MTVNLPDDVAARLAAEAARRGVSVDDLAAELLAGRLPEQAEDGIEEDALEAFIGCGASGRTEPFDLRQARRDLAEQKRAEGF